jgi:uncharacterized protein
MKTPHIKTFTLAVVFLLLFAGPICSQTQVVNEDLTGQTDRNKSLAPATEIIKISTQSEGYKLNGLLLRKEQSQEKLPAIIFLVGSGGSSSYSTDYVNFTRFFFEEILLDQGFAIVYFDKRGVESSEGVWYNTTFEQRALDARNIALEVGELEFIDKDQIFLIGHSQGGWIAQIAVATWPDLFAGAISMAGPTYGVRKQIIDEYHSRFICDENMSDEAALRKATRNVNRDLFFISFLGWSGNWKQLRIIRDFEADEYIRSITKPFLFLFAEYDELVNPEWAMEDFQKIFPDGPPPFIETYIAEGEHHNFRPAPACYRGEWRDMPYSESTRKKMAEWLISQVQQ